MRKIASIIHLVLAASAAAQSVRPVQHTNGIVVAPTNFWSANAGTARSGLGLAASWLTLTNAASFRSAIGLAGTWLTNASPPATTTTNASDLSAGTLADDRLSSSVVTRYQRSSASGTLEQLASGKPAITNWLELRNFVYSNDYAGNAVSLSAAIAGMATTSASALTSGTLADARLSTNVLTRTNTGTAAQALLTATNPAAAAAALGQSLGAPVFMRTSSRDTGGNNAGGIVSALSFDGIYWMATRNYTVFPVFSRDASTIWHSNRWVSVYTEAFNATNKTFGLATSADLLTWQTNPPVVLKGPNTAGTARNVWAPEWFVEGTNYYVIVRLSTSTNNNYGTPGMGWMRALDPGTWTNWTDWTPFDGTIRTDANDFYIVKKDNLYWLFSHGGTHLGGSQPAGSNIVNNITLQFSTNAFGNYSSMVEITEPLRQIIRPGNGSAFFEGPSVVHLEGPRWRLYFQDGLDNTAWAIDSYDNFASWDTNSLRRLLYSGFDGSGHGTVVKINATNQAGIRQAALALGTGPTIGGTWLTNTNTAGFRSAIGLGAAWLTNQTPPFSWSPVPAATNSPGSAGQMAYSNNHLYLCVAPNSWRRIQLGTW